MLRGCRALSLGLGLALSLFAPHANSATLGEEAAPDETGISLEYEHYTLDNGLEVLLHRDTSAPLVSVNLWYHVGSGDEVPGKSGFAHLFEHMMFQGAKHIGEDVHFNILREIGASGINGTTNSDRTNYFETVPSHEIETALWLESDRMGYMLDLLNQESLDNQIDVVRNERRQNYDNRPYGRERFAVNAALYPEGHPYRYLTIGKHEDLENASLEDVRDFFKKWYVPSNATIALAGDFEIDEAKALIDKWFGSFPALPKPEGKKVPAPELAEITTTEVEDPFARLERIHYVWHSPAMLAEGDLSLDVAAAALGSRGWGRLSSRLVDKDKIAQSVWVYQSGSGFSGTFNVVVTLPPGDTSEARKAVDAALKEELDKMFKDGPTQAELDRQRIGVESSFIWGLEDVAGRASRLQWFNHYTGDPAYSKTYLERLNALTIEGVRDTAKAWLSKNYAVIITVPAPAETGGAK